MKEINGLTDKEVLESRKKYGTNEINSTKMNSFLSLLIESLGDPIIKILLIALAIKTVFLFRNFDWFETIGILIAIFLASFISTISEYGSEKAFKKLQEESSKIKCKVKRNGIKSFPLTIKELSVKANNMLNNIIQIIIILFFTLFLLKFIHCFYFLHFFFNSKLL